MNKHSQLQEYFDALDRLKKGKPQRVTRGTRITNDSVSIEAGRGKGSIKKSRAAFTDLINAIDEAAREGAKSDHEMRDKLERTKSRANNYRQLYEAGLARELSLVHEVDALKQELSKYQKKIVSPLRR